MAGYANRVVTIHFPELSEPDDDVFVVMRNPKTVALSQMEAREVEKNQDGTPVESQASEVGYTLLARLIIGGRLYDATVGGVNADGTPVDQPLLTYPLSVAKAKALPADVINGIFERIQEAQNPH
jgi:hypothetical protein